MNPVFGSMNYLRADTAANSDTPFPPFSSEVIANIKSDYISKYPPVRWNSGYLLGTSRGELIYVVGGSIWMSQSIDSSDIISAPAVFDGCAVIGTKAGTLAKIDLKNFDIVWKFKAENAIVGKPLIDSNRVYFGCADQRFYCIDFDTGDLIFKHETSAPIWSTPAIAGENVIFGSDDNALRCLDKRTGKKLWDVKGFGWFEAEPMIIGDSIYIGSLDGRVYCVDVSSGILLWSTLLNGPVHSKGVRIGDSLVFGDESGTVSCIDIKSGLIIWQKPDYAGITAPLSSTSSVVYFVDKDKNFVGLDRDGNQVWARQINYAIRSALLVEGKSISMVSTDGLILKWNECAYAEVINPANKYLGAFDYKESTVHFTLEVASGRDDGRVTPSAIIDRPFEAGKRCKAVMVDYKGVKNYGNRIIQTFDVTIDVTDDSFCDGENDFSIYFLTNSPIKTNDGVYREPQNRGYVFERFTFDLTNSPKKCDLCEPCYDIKILPEGTPYFRRQDRGDFEIEITSKDGINRNLELEIFGTQGIESVSTVLTQRNGVARYNVSFDCMELSGGSYFTIPFEVTCRTCPSPNDRMTETWHTTRTIDFTTDPRLRIEMLPNSVDVLVNGEPVRLDVPSRIHEGRTLVPIRFVAETFGCKVDWDQETRKVTIDRRGTILIYWAYKNYADFNGERVEIDVGPIIERGRTLVPLRSIAESLGATVRWVEDTREIIIDWEF